MGPCIANAHNAFAPDGHRPDLPVAFAGENVAYFSLFHAKHASHQMRSFVVQAVFREDVGRQGAVLGWPTILSDFSTQIIAG